MLELSLDNKVDITRSALRHGAGLFETIRIQDGTPWRLPLHLERLTFGCAFLGLDEPPDTETVRRFVHGHGIGTSMEFGVLRLIAVDGKLLVFAELSPPRDDQPVSIGHSRESVRYSGNPLNRFKTLSYLENIRIAKEAVQRWHFDLIASNEKHCLTDGGRTTLFAVIGGRTLTPPIADGAMPGVARRVLLDAGLAMEASLTWEDLARTEAVFLANALRGVVPVGEIEGHGARPGNHPIIRRASECLEEK